MSGGNAVNVFKNKICDISESGAITTTSPSVNGLLLLRRDDGYGLIIISSVICARRRRAWRRPSEASAVTSATAMYDLQRLLQHGLSECDFDGRKLRHDRCFPHGKRDRDHGNA